MYFRYSQALMIFAAGFANGFVLEKRTHFGHAPGSIFTSSAVVDRRYSGRSEGAHICFSETNPPILFRKTAFIHQNYNGLHGRNFPENGGFVFENEPTGSGFWEAKRVKLECFGCRIAGWPGAVMGWNRDPMSVRFMPLIPKLTPMHPTVNVTRHAQC